MMRRRSQSITPGSHRILRPHNLQLVYHMIILLYTCLTPVSFNVAAYSRNLKRIVRTCLAKKEHNQYNLFKTGIILTKVHHNCKILIVATYNFRSLATKIRTPDAYKTILNLIFERKNAF